jgi:hypothetical protein
VFNIDIETCRECGGAVRIIACIDDPVVIEKILTRRPRCRAPPQGGSARLSQNIR